MSFELFLKAHNIRGNTHFSNKGAFLPRYIRVYKKLLILKDPVNRITLMVLFVLMVSARNAAKNGCQTKYTYIPDIDMVPTPGMDLELETFLEKEEKKNCSKCAYVIPTYEISHKSKKLPASKTELLSLIKRKYARQFHQTLYPINQKSSNLNKWEKMGQAKQMDIAYKVQQYIFKYEPLYIARGDTPQFDERFQGFGLTRNTQVEVEK